MQLVYSQHDVLYVRVIMLRTVIKVDIIRYTVKRGQPVEFVLLNYILMQLFTTGIMTVD